MAGLFWTNQRFFRLPFTEKKLIVVTFLAIFAFRGRWFRQFDQCCGFGLWIEIFLGLNPELHNNFFKSLDPDPDFSKITLQNTELNCIQVFILQPCRGICGVILYWHLLVYALPVATPTYYDYLILGGVSNTSGGGGRGGDGGRGEPISRRR